MTTKRGQLYDRLKAAGERGLTGTELGDLGTAGALAPHVESLRYEGHRVEVDWRKGAQGRFIPVYRLTHDAWAEVREAVVAEAPGS